MLDLHLIVQDLEKIGRNCQNRGVAVDLDRLAELAADRSRLIQEVEALRHRQKEVAASLKSQLLAAERAARIEDGRALKGQVSGLEGRLREVEADLHALQLQVPNLTHPAAPVGRGEEENRVVRQWGSPRRFEFAARDHVALGEHLRLIEFERAAKVAGQKFYYLTGAGALLELALIQYAMATLVEEGFLPVVTPDLARDEILAGIGFNPRGPETQIYSVEGCDLSLVATAEITLGGMYQDEILDGRELPILLAGFSHCFRTEAGAHGRVAKGLYRVHQFSKVEMFAVTRPEDSDAMHARLLALEEKLFQSLQIPYRVVDVCTGDLGGPAYRKFDLEAWMPGRGEGGSWGEVTSTSNCTDYQARRLRVRYRPEPGARPEFVHMLNGTAVAVSRAIIAILENLQEADGSVRVPEVLQRWMGTDWIRPPATPAGPAE